MANVRQLIGHPPFPFNLPVYLRPLFSLYLLLILVLGLKFRKVIFDYLVCPDTKRNPINRLIQANLISGSLFGTSNLLIGIAGAVTSLPLSQVIGDSFCRVFAFQSILHLTGSIIWTCLLAVCRILYIKVPSLPDLIKVIAIDACERKLQY